MLAVAVLAAAGVAGCSGGSDDGGSGAPTTTTAAARPAKAGAAPVSLASLDVDPATQERCDPIAPTCLLPWPNDHFTVADDTTPTGRRLALDRASMPANADGVHVDVTDQDRADGWSPGSAIMTQVPGVDAARSRLAGLRDPARSLRADAPIVLVDAATRSRLPYWAELDANADDGEDPVLLIHPARNLPDGHRIVVALRGLRDAAGKAIAPTKAFAAYRDGQRTTDATFEARRPAMERTFRDLGRAGVERAALHSAWDFTVASTESLTGRMLALRDGAFAELDGKAPAYRITTVTEAPDDGIRRRIEGTFDVPLYLTDGGRPGGRFVLGDDGRPTRVDGTFTAAFRCDLPATDSTAPARLALYGHGLLGDLGEMSGSLTRRMAQDHNIVYCATNWYGMAEEDIPNAARVLADLSGFDSIADRLQQGILGFLVLGRLMVHDQGFVADPAFAVDGRPVIDNSRVYYDGNSQGAILGGAFLAVSQDVTRGVFAEAGMNYGLLLDRSVDFDEYLNGVLKPAYPARIDRLIGMAAVQLLWDRGETDGYANHVTRDPLPDTPRHHVLLLGAVGDHQVTEYSLRVEAATMRVPAHEPIAAPGRVVERDPGWLLDEATDPQRGSLYILWDTGSPRSPVANVPPRTGHDPHDDTPNIPAVRDLKSRFWQDDPALPDPCGGKACAAPTPPENED